MDLTQTIKSQALKLGFDVVGITDALPVADEHVERLKHWLARGCAGDMGYMHNNLEKRINPALLLEGAKSVICVGLNYKPADENAVNICKIATYAFYKDYHKFIKERLFLLSDFIAGATCESPASSFKFKVCVDSAPLAERALAVRAGLGFIGKNRMLTNPIFGQQLLLGELITTLQLVSDQEVTNDCSGCSNCLKACPTGALSDEGLDARRCISYLTIEHKGVIPQGLSEKMGGRFFGCDECVRACVRQKDAPPAQNKEFKFHKAVQSLDLSKVLDMEEGDFKRRFADSPIQRIGFERLKRNAVICLLNSSRSS